MHASCSSVSSSGASFYSSTLDSSSFACVCFNLLTLYFGKFQTYRKTTNRYTLDVHSSVVNILPCTTCIHIRIPVFFQNNLKILANFIAFNREIVQSVSSPNKNIPLHDYISQVQFPRKPVLRWNSNCRRFKECFGDYHLFKGKSLQSTFVFFVF